MLRITNLKIGDVLVAKKPFRIVLGPPEDPFNYCFNARKTFINCKANDSFLILNVVKEWHIEYFDQTACEIFDLLELLSSKGQTCWCRVLYNHGQNELNRRFKLLT